MILVILTTSITVVGLTGFIYSTDVYINNDFEDMQLLFYIACITVSNIKVVIIIYNSDEIRKLFDLSHESFLSNKYCKKKYQMKNFKKQSVRTFVWYIFFFYSTALLWILLPNTKIIDETTNMIIRKNNVLNLKYPITVKTYNTYYNIFYVIESILTIYCGFELIMFDVFLLSTLQLISTRYEMVSSAYQNIVLNVQNESRELKYY